MIFISSGGCGNKTAHIFSKELLKLGAGAIELSGGIYDEHQLQKLKRLDEALTNHDRAINLKPE